MDYKAKCIEIMDNTRKELIDIIKSMGVIENHSIETNRDLGDFVEYATINKIVNGVVYYNPTDIYPDGFKEDLDELSVNELYYIIMAF